MPLFGFKVVDRQDPELGMILDYATRQSAPIEIGLFFDDQHATDLVIDRLRGSQSPIGVHLDHRALSLLGLSAKETPLRAQLERAASMGATFAVTHLGEHPMASRQSLRDRLWDRVAAEIDFLQSVSADYGVRPYIENTFHPLPFYREMAQSVFARRGKTTDLCFDLGHAHVWSSEPLRDWLSFLGTQAALGAHLHFHLHANDGLTDQHLPFMALKDQESASWDDFRGSMTWLEALCEIHRRFANAAKVFEVPQEDAIANYEAVLPMLGQAR